MTIQRIDPNPRLSAGVVFSDLVFLSGQVPTTLDGDVALQTTEVLEKIDALLAKANSDKSRILSAQIWLKDIAKDFTVFNELWEKWLPAGCSPSRAAIQADMARPQVLVEVMVIAAKK